MSGIKSTLKNVTIRTCLLLLSLFAAFTITRLHAHVRLPALVSDGMVLQRDTKLKIWGWADPGEKIRVNFKGKNYSATAAPDSSWLVQLPPLKAGGPYSLQVNGSNNTITVKNILVGDVWLCAGQSNMVHYLELHKDRYAADIAAANYPNIRQFVVPTNPQLSGPAKDIPASGWKAATPGDVLRFSVVAYFFARELYEKYDVPIGLINASVGGPPAEAWTSEEGLRTFPDMLATIQQNKDTAWVNRVNSEAAARRQKITNARPDDLGLAGPTPWYDTGYEPRDWNPIIIPGYWEDQGLRDLNGVVWYRREIDVPAAMTGIPARINMGRIVDADYVYVNGQQVGNKTYQYPQRRYDIAAGVLKPGKNSIVVRVLNYAGKGGFVPDKPYHIAAGGDTLDLKGEWQYKVGAAYPPEPENVGSISAQNQPSALYNGMVAPFANHAIKGVLWYQGESNESRAETYETLLRALIHDWRGQWNDEDLPFLYAQLPNYMDVNYLPSESNWALLREAQRKALDLPHTGMAVTIDLGEWNDIHPGNKKPIGERLALAAQKIAYHEENIVYSGPLYKEAIFSAGKVELDFDHTGSGLVAKDGEALKWFAVAGEDKKFAWANAAIEGDKVVVWNDGVPNPLYVRYAWADNPDGANLYNKEGLPASPFEAAAGRADELWYGKKAAVVLTYDDALDVHLDNAIPALDSLGFKGSFYLSAAFPGSKNRLADWRQAAENGHELGNHTLFHPCDASKPGRSWVSTDNDLSKYTTEQIVREIEMTNVFLESLDGQKDRTFAYTCGDTTCAEGSFVDAIKDKFVSLRGVHGDVNQFGTTDLTNLNCYVVDESNADQLVSWAEKAKAENALLVVLFHGVGGGHPINATLQQHNDFLKYLKKNEGDYWVATLKSASSHIIQHSGNE